MKYEDYEKNIKEIIAKPDTAMAEIGKVLEELKTDLTTFQTITEEHAAMQTRIEALQETNARLFLGVTGKSEESNGSDADDDDDLEGADAIDAFVAKMTQEKEGEK